MQERAFTDRRHSSPSTSSTATDTATVVVENTADGTEVSIGGEGALGFEQ